MQAVKGQSLGLALTASQALRDNRNSEAVALLNRAVALDPSAVVTRTALADLYFTSREFELALEEYKTVEAVATEQGSRPLVRHALQRIKEIERLR